MQVVKVDFRTLSAEMQLVQVKGMTFSKPVQRMQVICKSHF
jgi:hypothetical protein